MVREVRNMALSDIEEEIALVEAEMVAMKDGIKNFMHHPVDIAAARRDRPAAECCRQGYRIGEKIEATSILFWGPNPLGEAAYRRMDDRWNDSSWGSRKNKFAILGVKAPAYQGAKTQEYLDIPSFRNVARRDASASKM
jgi:hypothetical protein